MVVQNCCQSLNAIPAAAAAALAAGYLAPAHSDTLIHAELESNKGGPIFDPFLPVIVDHCRYWKAALCFMNHLLDSEQHATHCVTGHVHYCTHLEICLVLHEPFA